MARKNAMKATTPTPPTRKETIHAKKEMKKQVKKEENPACSANGWIAKLLTVVAAVAAVGVTYYLRDDSKSIRFAHYISRNDVTEHLRYNVTCASMPESDGFVQGCHQKNQTTCGRAIIDNFVTLEEVTKLREVAEIGMENRSALGGPTIMDINTGFVRDSNSLVNIYQPESRIPDENKPGVKRFDKKQFNLYRQVVGRIRRAVMKEFGLDQLYFSAPTFIARLVGNDSWTPVEIHDEYWHPHVDKENTKHYDYSSLLYLSDFNEDFTGGLFSFIDENTETAIEPARGRLVMFTAGSENLHVVRKVKTGTRYALSLWFSCDERKKFENFLNGVMHKHFRRT